MYGIVENVRSDRALRTGAKVWLLGCHGDAECPIMTGISKSGRRIRKFTHYKRLTSYRPAWIPEYLLSDIWPSFQHETREASAEHAVILATMWAGIRSFTRDGSALRYEGLPTSEAFRRVRGIS
jgi:hypothetical protein